MDRAIALETLDTDSGRLLRLAASGAGTLEAPIPACPGWDVAQLVLHLGVIYSRVALVTREHRIEVPDRSELPQAPGGEERLNWFAEQRAAVLEALADVPADTPVWNWTEHSPGPASFWWRRMVHETLVHRVDVEQARRLDPTPAAPDIAVDAIEEYLELFFPRLEAGLPEGGVGGSVHLHATDLSDAEWTLEPRPGGSSITREHAKADVALRSSASDLALFVWGRLPVGKLEVLGDRQIADRWLELLNP